MPRVNPILRDDPASVLEIDALLREQRSDVCFLLAPSYTIDAGGAPISTSYIPVGTHACKVAEGGLGAREAVAGAVFRAVSDYVVHFDRELVVASDYRIRKDGSDGVLMEVTGESGLASHGMELLVSANVVS